MAQNRNIKICIIRNDRMGDMILTLPIIREIKETVPNSTVTVVCSNKNSFLCEETDFIDEVLIYETQLDLIYKIKFYLKFVRNRYDYIFNFSQNIESFLFFLVNFSKEKLTLIYLSRYKNPKFSKIFQRLMSTLFFVENLKIDRKELFKKKLNIHQTEMMYQLVKKKLFIKKPKLFHLTFTKKETPRYFEKRILIHLPGRWIDDKYSENNMLELLNKLKDKYGEIYITTDQSSERKFRKIYHLYEKYNDENLHEICQTTQKIIILDKLNFKNWREVILNSKFVITYECGCVHVASMSNVPLLVVYDYKNKPYMINKEYAPYTKKYQKVIARQDNINKEIMSKLKKMNANNSYKT